MASHTMQDEFTSSLRLQFLTDTAQGYLLGKDVYQSPLTVIPPVFAQYTGLAKEYHKEDWFVNTGWTHIGYEIYHRKFYLPNPPGPRNFNGYVIFPNADREEEYLQDILNNPEPAEEDWMI